MSSASNITNGNPPPGGLPPVAPPTAGFLARLFLVPALIVAVLVGVAFLFHLSFGWLFGSPQTPEQFLAKLDNPNPEERWRGASHLSQVLPRDDRLASNADFALELVKRLKQTRDDNKAAELEVAKRFPPLTPEELDKLGDDAWLKREKDLERENKKLDAERTYVQFLTACLGNFMVPVGVPVLRDLATQESGIEADQLVVQRRRAVAALAVLGENCQRFDKLTADEQQTILDQLEEACKDPQRADDARPARDFLRKRQQNVPDAMGVDLVTEACARAEDPYLRELTAWALNFWSGSDAVNQRIEKTLDELAHDSGRGTLTVEQLRAQARLDKLKDYPNPSNTISYSVPAELTIKFNATTTLARRGSDLVRSDVLAEMLDEDKLRGQFLYQELNAANPKPAEESVVQVLVYTLKAVADLHKKRPEKVTTAIRAAVDKLKGNGNAAVKNEAAQTALEIGSGQ